MEGAKTASRLLQVMMSDDNSNEKYIYPNQVLNAHVTNFIANARIHGPAGDIPDEAEAAKAWAKPWMQVLHSQASKESEYFMDVSRRQLFSPSSKDEVLLLDSPY